MIDRDLIAEARKLLAAAKESPWWISRMGDIYAGDGSGDSPVVADNADQSDGELIVWMRNNLPALLDEIEQLQRGGKYLGEIIEHQCRIALDATGLHDLIDEDGDGDWQAVWDNVAELGSSLEKLRADRAEELVAIAEKQRRDNARIAELEATQQEPAGYVVGRKTAIGWGFAAAYGGPELTRAGAEQELAGAIEGDGPEFGWRLLEVREVQP